MKYSHILCTTNFKHKCLVKRGNKLHDFDDIKKKKKQISQNDSIQGKNRCRCKLVIAKSNGANKREVCVYSLAHLFAGRNSCLFWNGHMSPLALPFSKQFV